MSKWKECSLATIAEVQTGPFGSQLHNRDYVDFGTPIVTVEHLGSRKMTLQNLPCVSDADRIRLNKYSLQQGDLVFSRVGSVDRCSFVGEEENGWLFSGRCLRVRPKTDKMDSNYLYYFFCLESTKETIRRVAVGATMPSINTELLSSLTISFPPLPVQRAIAEVLSSLDDKIDLLTRQNATLEALAQTYFRQWFVEEAGADWEEGTLGNIVEFNYGKALKGDERSGSGYPVVGSSGIVGYHSDFLVTAPGLVTGRKGTLGVINYMFDNFYPIDTTFYVSSKIGSKNLLFEYFLLRSCGLANMNSDSAVPGLNRNAAHSIPIQIPPKTILNKFDHTAKPFFDKTRANHIQILTLQTLRDTLLPKLISGEVTVENGDGCRYNQHGEN